MDPGLTAGWLQAMSLVKPGTDLFTRLVLELKPGTDLFTRLVLESNIRTQNK